MPSILENNLLLQYMSGAGAEIAGPGSFAAGLNKMTQQNIAAQSQHKTNQNYIQMLKEMLNKGGKIGISKDDINIKAPANMFGGGQDSSGPGSAGYEHSIMSGLLGGAEGGIDTRSGMSAPRAVPQQYADPGVQPVEESRNVLNPSPSPLGVNAADLAGLTPENVSQALSGALGAVNLEQQTIAGVAEGAYRKAATRQLEAQTRAATPSIKIPGTDITLTEGAFIDWYKASTKDDRTAAIKGYEYAVDQGYKGSFQEWTTDLAEASGKSLAETLAQVAAVDTVKDKLKIGKVDYVADIEKDLQKDEDSWYRPPNYKVYVDKGLSPKAARIRGQQDLVLKRIDRDIRGRYPNSNVVGKPDGWYVDGKLIRKNPYGNN